MAKKTDGGFFTKLLIISAILLGSVLSYSYIIGNSIQPQLGVVEKIYVGIFSSAETISGEKQEFKTAYNLQSSIKITQETKKIFEGDIKIDNAQIFSNTTGLEQQISADLIHVSVDNKGEKQEKKLEKLDIISKNENIYISSGKGLKDFSKYIGEYIDIPLIGTIEKISNINQKGNYAQINNTQPFQKNLPKLSSDHVVNQIFTSLITSNPKEYFKKNNVSNLVKQSIFNDQWIEYFFIENKKISEKNKKFFVMNKNICTQINPFLDTLSESIKQEKGKTEGCEYAIKDITPFIALVSQIYKFGDIENGNYDFVISQGTNIDIRFSYANHILQTWNIFIQNPENTIKISIVGDKFGMKESQLTFKKNKEKQKIIGSIVNGTGNISINIDEKDRKINGNIILQNYLLVDLDISGKGTIEGRDMKFEAVGDYKVAKIDYTEKQEETIYKALNITYADKNYKFDYISPAININSLYTVGKFIGGFAEKSDEGIVIKEIKYVYDQGKIKGHYRIPDFEGNVEGEILSQNTFELKLGMKQKQDQIKMILTGKQKSDSEIQYSAEGMMNNELLFTLSSENTHKNNISTVIADIDIPSEKIQIEFKAKSEKIPENNNYQIPTNIQKVDISMNEMVLIPNIHQLKKILGPEFIFAGVTLGSVGMTTSYLSSQTETRKLVNENRISDMKLIAKYMNGLLENEEFDMSTLIQERDKNDDKSTLRIGGEKIGMGDKYMVGTIDYEVLGIAQDEFKSTNQEFKLALLFHGEKTQYQILGYGEEAGSQLKVMTEGNYIPREFIRYDFKIVTPEGSDSQEKSATIQINITQEHDLKIGDMTNLGRILDMVDENIFIENDIHPDISKIYLLGNDAPTLFIDKNNKALENGQIIIKK